MNTLNPVIGVYEFETVVQQGYYVDKTEALQYIYDLGDGGTVALFCRPRRFGKSLMLSMADTFFDVRKGDKSGLFEHFKVASLPCFAAHNSVPVIHLDFKNCLGENAETILGSTFRLIREAFERYLTQDEIVGLSSSETDSLRALRNGNASRYEYESSLLLLSKAVCLQSGCKPMLLLDEYDAQMNDAFAKGFLDEVSPFFKAFYGSGLKGNPYLRVGIITGVLPFANDSLSSGWNSSRLDNGVYTVFPSECFAFSEEEVDRIMQDYHTLVPKEKIRQWYGNYVYGEKTYYNPWSIMNFFAGRERFNLYWNRTGSLSVIEDLLRSGSTQLNAIVQKIYAGGEIDAQSDFSYRYGDIYATAEAALLFLYSSGYLTSSRFDEEGRIYFAIPNQEVRLAYKKNIMDYYESKGAPLKNLGRLKECFLRGEVEEIQDYFEELLTAMNFTEYGNWMVYQSLVAFVCATVFDNYVVDQEISSGDGRCDIFMEPRDPREPGFLLEVKSSKTRTSEARLISLSSTCLAQMERMRYAERLQRKGVKEIHLYGVAFSWKRCRVSHKVVTDSDTK